MKIRPLHAGILLLFLLFPHSLDAEIYSLWPFSEDSAASRPFYSEKDDPAGLPERKFWDEEILVNGRKLHLDISLVDLPFSDAAALLKKRAPDAPSAGSPDSFLIHLPLADGSVRRVWLLALRGIRPVLLFSIVLPSGLKEAPESAWPKIIPLPPGAVARSVMSFPVRQADFVSFQLPNMTQAQALHEMGQRLKSAGWQPASEEIADPFRASGEVFFREKPLRILLLGAMRSSGQGTVLTVYTRPVEKAK